MTRDEQFKHIWGTIGPQGNRTKCPEWRVRNLFDRIYDVIDNKVKGDFVEAGVWKGGMCALMAYLAEYENKGRLIWAFDSFKGMSTSDVGIDGMESRAPQRQLRNFSLYDFNHTCFNLMGVRRETVGICEGWLSDTLPKYGPHIKNISILRIDVDWWEPTNQVLQYFYPKVSPGGFIICDDYGYWRGARKAIDEYRLMHGIIDPLHQTLDGTDLKKGTEHWWRKEPEGE